MKLIYFLKMKFKKPKFWDLKKPNFTSYLLFPFTIFFELNNFFQSVVSKKKINAIKSICIGNIYLGGTGKTPSTIRLYEILKKTNFNVCTGKKYYQEHFDEQTMLDEKTNLIVDNNRIKIIEEALKQKFELVIFDDGLQDKTLNYNLKIVCFDVNKWIGNGQLIPSGPLREKLKSLKKYDAVFLKNHNSYINDIKQILKKHNPLIKIFHSKLNPTNLNNFDLNQNYTIFSGIGNPENFKDLLEKNNFKIVKEIIFPDHYNYKKKDIDNIKSIANTLNAKIITTEKDFVKIPKIAKENIKYLQTSLKFDNENELIDFIKVGLDEKN